MEVTPLIYFIIPDQFEAKGLLSTGILGIYIKADKQRSHNKAVIDGNTNVNDHDRKKTECQT